MQLTTANPSESNLKSCQKAPDFASRKLTGLPDGLAVNERAEAIAVALDELVERYPESAEAELATLAKKLGRRCRETVSREDIYMAALTISADGFSGSGAALAGFALKAVGMALRPQEALKMTKFALKALRTDSDLKAIADLEKSRHFYQQLKDAFELLWDEGAEQPKMMSVGLHPRISGHPARARALARFLDELVDAPRTWVCRRVDIARHWMREHPRP